MQERRLVHRDVSIENILLTDEGGVRLCDFGVAVELPFDSWIISDQIPVGKIRFMSPEVFVRGAYDASLNDVWCLGVYHHHHHHSQYSYPSPLIGMFLHDVDRCPAP